MHTPHKTIEIAFISILKSHNKAKVKVEIRCTTNFCNKMPCVLNKLRLAVDFSCLTATSSCRTGSPCTGVVSEIVDFDNTPSTYNNTPSGTQMPNRILAFGSVCPICAIFRPPHKNGL